MEIFHILMETSVSFLSTWRLKVEFYKLCLGVNSSSLSKQVKDLCLMNRLRSYFWCYWDMLNKYPLSIT